MARPSRENAAVREFILRNVTDKPDTVSSIAATQFGLSRAAISGYMQRLIAEGLLTAEGNTRARRYALKSIFQTTFQIEVSAGLAEDQIWRFRILDHVSGIKKNVLDICQYGFTEMLNNVIDHSLSKTADILFDYNYARIKMLITDEGVGVFEKIKNAFGLADARSALLELAKGRLTTDRARHSGEGIFFTSRMFNQFEVASKGLFYRRTLTEDSEWLIEAEETTQDGFPSTAVRMTITTDSETTTRRVFEKYESDEIGFRKTHVPIKLGRYPGEQLVSRSQAKRILSRFENFSEVMLDFQGVEQIGQPFADEIFRVFKASNPNIDMHVINTSPEIDRMIAFVRAAAPPEDS
ncbi:MAG TPA: DUF4325 domain-containing protein [Magnetospirillaceae bacterium]|jgi:anti-sigma regulatory factor (Ser/Thr protein kinase)